MTNPKGRRYGRRGPRQSGFSLIELAAMLACTVLLIAMVQPSLDLARERSKNSVCLERLRAIAAASLVYAADDTNGWVIPVHDLMWHQDPNYPSHIGAYEWGGKSGIGSPGWVPGPSGDYAFLTSKYGTKAGFGPATRPLNGILYPHGFRDNLSPRYDSEGAVLDTRLELPAYRCPADDGPPGGAHCPDWMVNPDRSSYDHFGTSYAANIFMTSYVGGGWISSNSPYLRPLSRVPNPARVLEYEENIGRWAWECRRQKPDCAAILGSDGIDPGPTKAVRGWHGKDWTYNRAFIDGHAETQRILLEGTEDAEGYFVHYWTEVVFEDEMQQNNSVCIIVRGPGWQKDTLPAPPIPTGLMWNGGHRPSYDGCVFSD